MNESSINVGPNSYNASYQAPGSLDFSAVTSEFKKHMEEADFDPIPSVPITAKLDKTVRFIGAPISVMKPMVLQGEIPDSGAYMIQNCIRTANTKSLFDLEELPEYGSFFTAMCAVTEYRDLTKLFFLTTSYMVDRLNIDPSDIYISIDGSDRDLIDAARQSGVVETKLDTQPADLYRHKYGIDGVWGRNISYWMKNTIDNTYEDIGNIIVIEDEKEHLGVELALGDTTLVKQINGLKHVQDAYNLALVDANTPEAVQRKIEDTVITGLALYSEGLRPGAKDNQARILRTYMKAASLYQKFLNIDIDEFRDRVTRLEERVLPFSAIGQGKHMTDWMIEYHKALESGRTSNKEDEVVLNILGGTALRDSVVVSK